MRRLALAMAAMVALSGCYRIRFHHSKLISEGGAPREIWHHGVADGLWEVSGPVKLDEMCPTGEAVVENEQTALQGLIQEATALIFVAAPLAGGTGALPYTVPWQIAVGRHLTPWTPTTVRVWCARGALAGKKFAMLNLVPAAGVDPKLADLITSALVSELRRRPGVSVLAQSDITALVGMERQEMVLGCSEGSSCMAELADALGAERMIHGTVGRVGGELVIEVSSVDTAHARTVAQVSERVRSEGALFDALPAIANQLLAEPLAPAQ